MPRSWCLAPLALAAVLDGCGGGSGGGSGVAPAAEPRGGAPQGSRWLRVSGPRIVDDAGRPFRLVGMGLSPIHSEWTLGGASSVGDVAAHYRTLGCNSMRIGFASSHTYDQSLDLAQEMGVDAFIEREIAPQLQAVLAQGMYAVVDLHRYFDDKSMPTMSVDARVEYLYRTIIPLWEHIARRYKDEPMIAMYELWNEPRWPGYDVGDVRQIPALRQWYLDAVRAVRRIDTRHIILVSDHNAGWGSGREQMWLAPGGTLIGVDSISPPRIAYSHHAAALSEQRGENERADEFARKHAVPVVYGEVELQPDVDSNDVLGAQQPMMLSRLVARLLANGLCQGWQGWRSGMDEWLDVWLPLTRTDHECRH